MVVVRARTSSQPVSLASSAIRSGLPTLGWSQSSGATCVIVADFSGLRQACAVAATTSTHHALRQLVIDQIRLEADTHDVHGLAGERVAEAGAERRAGAMAAHLGVGDFGAAVPFKTRVPGQGDPGDRQRTRLNSIH